MSQRYIVLSEGKVVHRKYQGKCCFDTPAKVSANKLNITLGCTTISVEAAKYIMNWYKQKFEEPDLLTEKLLQEGSDFEN